MTYKSALETYTESDEASRLGTRIRTDWYVRRGCNPTDAFILAVKSEAAGNKLPKDY